MRIASFLNHPFPTNKDEYVVLVIEVEVYYREKPGTFVRLQVKHVKKGLEIYAEHREHGSIVEAYEYAANLLHMLKDWKHQTQTGK